MFDETQSICYQTVGSPYMLESCLCQHRRKLQNLHSYYTNTGEVLFNSNQQVYCRQAVRLHHQPSTSISQIVNSLTQIACISNTSTPRRPVTGSQLAPITSLTRFLRTQSRPPTSSLSSQPGSPKKLNLLINNLFVLYINFRNNFRNLAKFLRK